VIGIIILKIDKKISMVMNKELFDSNEIKIAK